MSATKNALNSLTDDDLSPKVSDSSSVNIMDGAGIDFEFNPELEKQFKLNRKYGIKTALGVKRTLSKLNCSISACNVDSKESDLDEQKHPFCINRNNF